MTPTETTFTVARDRAHWEALILKRYLAQMKERRRWGVR